MSHPSSPSRPAHQPALFSRHSLSHRLVCRLTLLAAAALAAGAPARVQAATPSASGGTADETWMAASQTLAQAGAQQSWDLPAGALDDMLARIARASGKALSADPALLRGKTAPAVRGSFSAEEAAARALAGSGLVLARVGAEGWTVVAGQGPAPASPQTDRSLAPVIVTDAALQAYRAKTQSAATKTPTELIDTPTSVTVLTERLIQDQAVESQSDLLRNAPSVTRSANQGNVGGSQNNSLRGFNTRAIYKDGNRFTTVGEVVLDNIESVEVVKGPASVLYGTIQPGGLIAYNRKKPQAQAYRNVSLSLGSDSHQKLSADLTGPLNDSGELSYRLVASALRSDTFIDFNHKDADFIAPALRFQNRDWLVDVGYEYSKFDETFVYGIPIPGRTPDNSFRRDLFLGHPDNIKLSTDKTAYLKATRRLGDESSVTVAASHAEYIHESYAYRPGSYDPATRRYSPFGSVRPPTVTNDEDALEVYGSHGFKVAGRRNLFAGGLELRQRRNEGPPCNGNLANAYSASVDAPDYSRSPNLIRPVAPGVCAAGTVNFDLSETRQKERALFAQNTFWLTDDLQLLAGLRHVTVEQTSRNFSRNTTTRQKDDATTGRIGVLYKLTPSTSLYGSYSESFEQLIGTAVGGGSFEPTEGRQFELGFKRELGRAGAFITGSVYAIEQKNLTIADPNNPGFSIQEGRVKSDGAELEITGAITPRFNLTGGVGYIDNRVVGGPNNGRRLANVYKTKASLFGIYRLTEAWSVGGGAFYHGNAFINALNDKQVPPATVFDLVATWSQRAFAGKTTLQINLKNVFDKRDYDGGFGTGTGAHVFPVPGRQLFVKLGYEF